MNFPRERDGDRQWRLTSASVGAGAAMQYSDAYVGGRYFPGLPTVYLAGDVFKPWRGEVVRAAGGAANFRDPAMLAARYPAISMDAIAQAELAWVGECHLVFAFIHEGHKSATGTPAEIGYAKARGIPILLVDERQDAGTEWLRALATKSTSHLGTGIEMLKLILERGHEGIRRFARCVPVDDGASLAIGGVTLYTAMQVLGPWREKPGPKTRRLKNYGPHRISR